MNAPPTAERMLEGLYQHRLLSTSQLHALYTPQRSPRRTRQLVTDLEQAGYADAVRQPGGQKIVYLTPAGIDAAERVPRTEPRRKQLTEGQAAGPLQRHTLAVNDTGIAFVNAARERGDDCGPLSWRHEIAHPIGPPPGRRRPEELIADALLIYQQTAGQQIQFHYRFIELDRATMPVDALAAKLARYARLYGHTMRANPGRTPVPFWATRYPVFPTVLLALDGATPERLRRRRGTVLTLCGEDPDLRRTPEVEISACLLEDLRATGPFSGIWRTAANQDRSVDWLGQPSDPPGRPTARSEV